ncbi:MAG: chromosome segregation SMC family protein [Candidatus Paceibacterota bacterium]
MILKRLELCGFKSFARKSKLEFNSPVTAIVGPNGSGKSNIAEAFRFVLGEQSFKSMRGKRGEDMIFSGSANSRRANFAEVVLVFDNSDRRFSGIDFDEVEISRVVHRDGDNNYYINGSKARLKDIIELLSAVHIGASAHHIISQGETDRILNAKPLERRSIVEEALGLKVYQYKRKESEKKLVKTEENLKEVKALRRELAPRMEFLKEQVTKIEKARSIQDELTHKYREFLRREYVYINYTRYKLERERKEPEARLEEIKEEIDSLKEEMSRDKAAESKNSEIIELEESQKELDDRRGVLLHEMGRIEAEIQFQKNQLSRIVSESNVEPTVSWSRISSFIGEIEGYLGKARSETSIDDVHRTVEALRERIRAFLGSFSASSSSQEQEKVKLKEEISSLEKQKENKNEDLERIKEEAENLKQKRKALQDEAANDHSASREAERRMFERMNEQQRLRTRLDKIKEELSRLDRVDAGFKYEIQEAARLLGAFILDYKNYEVKDEEGRVLSEEEIANNPREDQEQRRKDIERLKVRLEELSVGSHQEIMKEYEEVTDRDEFLAKEVTDLEQSISSLRSVIAELEETIENRFQEGLRKVNETFQEFFKEMFGGGSASLKLVKLKTFKESSEEDPEENGSEEEESEYLEGLEISVSLPRKNVKGLLMLSGGERALVSIALIFAMSQVNPPPFLILDETDAALDEANSRKYGSMIRHLAKHSQLIIITHNRETMAIAGVLYGVTMDSNGVSGLLSVRLGSEPSEQ